MAQPPIVPPAASYGKNYWNPRWNLFCFVIFKQLSLERELIKVQGNLEAEMNMRGQANSAKADIESKWLLLLVFVVVCWLAYGSFMVALS